MDDDVYLGRMFYRTPKDGWLVVDTDGKWFISTAMTFCRLAGLPYKSATKYAENHKDNSHCSDNLYGPPFETWTANVPMSYDVNCDKAGIETVTSLDECKPTSRVLHKEHPGCDGWIICQSPKEEQKQEDPNVGKQITFRGNQYDYQNFDNGDHRLQGIKMNDNLYLGRMFYKRDPYGWLVVDTDNKYFVHTAKTFCRLVGLPYQKATKFDENYVKTGKCSDDLYGPPFETWVGNVNPFYDANCNKASVETVTSLSECKPSSKVKKLEHNGCDGWIWCKGKMAT